MAEPEDQEKNEGENGANPGVKEDSPSISNAKFTNIADKEDSRKEQIDINSPLFKENIKLILDVPMNISVELGRSKRSVEEVLALGEGSVIELDRLAGEPIDLLVNGKVIAKGEVVVIDESFGIRITSIVSREQRIIDINLL